MDTPATYVEFGFVLISIPNLLLLVLMLVLFIGALLLPFPGMHDKSSRDEHDRG